MSQPNSPDQNPYEPGPSDQGGSPYGTPPASPQDQPSSPYGTPPAYDVSSGSAFDRSPYANQPSSPYGDPPMSPYVASPYSDGPAYVGSSSSQNKLGAWALGLAIAGLLCGVLSLGGLAMSIQARNALQRGTANNKGVVTTAFVLSIIGAAIWAFGYIVRITNS